MSILLIVPPKVMKEIETKRKNVKISKKAVGGMINIFTISTEVIFLR